MKGTWAKCFLPTNLCFLNHLALCLVNPGMWDGQDAYAKRAFVLLGDTVRTITEQQGTENPLLIPFSSFSHRSPHASLSPLPPEDSQEAL